LSTIEGSRSAVLGVIEELRNTSDHVDVLLFSKSTIIINKMGGGGEGEVTEKKLKK
jgi:hypothetical protein